MSGSKATFRSYVDFATKTNGNEANREPSPPGQPKFLPNEIVTGFCENVIFYAPFTDNRQGILGNLYCTDFRLAFVPLIHISATDQDVKIKRSLLFDDEYEVPLSNIHSIKYKVSKGDNKFRTLNLKDSNSKSLGITDKLSLVEVHCVDFRVFIFDFKTASPVKDVEVINSVAKFSLLDRWELMFAFRCGLAKENRPLPSAAASPPKNSPRKFSAKFSDFNSVSDWEAEIQRLERAYNSNSISKFFRISHVNGKLTCADSYPEVVVVPKTLVDNSIAIAAPNWAQQRFPIWCWSAPNGSALMRSSRMNVHSEIADKQWHNFLQALIDAHPGKQAPAMIDCDLELSEIANAFDSLRRLCEHDAVATFWLIDSRWRSQLEATKWMDLVARCLAWTLLAVQGLESGNQLVLLREESGRDVTAVVASLAQICLDEHFRTRQGFLSLIDKEWIALGHPFCSRLYKLSQSPGEMAPVFLLFLDCVAQIFFQNSREFEFSAHFLVAIWDATLTGLCQNFCADSIKNRAAAQESLAKVPALNADLDRFFSADYQILFLNPKFWRFFEIFGGGSQKSPRRAKRVVLTPFWSQCDLNFFADLYLRWCRPSHAKNGGAIQAHLFELRALGEIFQYYRQLKKFSSPSVAKSAASQSPSVAKSADFSANFLADSLPFCERFESLVNSGFPYCAEVTPSPEQSHSGPAVIGAPGKERYRQSIASFTSWVELDSDEKGQGVMNRSFGADLDDDSDERLEMHESKSDVRLRRLEAQKLNTLV